MNECLAMQVNAMQVFFECYANECHASVFPALFQDQVLYCALVHSVNYNKKVNNTTTELSMLVYFFLAVDCFECQCRQASDSPAW